MATTLTLIETLILTYGPILISIIYTIVNWISVIKKLKSVKITEETKEVISGQNDKIQALIDSNKLLCQENAKLRQQQNEIIETLTKIEVKDNEK